MRLKNSYSELEKLAVSIINLELFKTTCKNNDMTVWDLLKNQIIYDVVKGDDDKYEVVRFLVVNTVTDGYHLWKDDGYYNLDENDIIYDNYDEAAAQRDRLNNSTKFFCVKKGESKVIWNVVVNTGIISNVLSFTTRESAIAKYYEYLEYDKRHGKVDENVNGYDYTCTYTGDVNGQMRCMIVSSLLDNK